MKYPQLRTEFIHISDKNRENLSLFQAWSFVSVALSGLIYYMAIGFREGVLPIHYDNAVEKILIFLAVLGFTLFILGLYYRGLSHVFLLSEYWKKQWLVNASFPRHVTMNIAWIFPACLIYIIFTTSPDLHLFKQIAIVGVGVALAGARMRTATYRYAAMDQFKTECPPEHFDDFGGAGQVLR
jgi:hypothetical protein